MLQRLARWQTGRILDERPERNVAFVAFSHRSSLIAARVNFSFKPGLSDHFTQRRASVPLHRRWAAFPIPEQTGRHGTPEDHSRPDSRTVLSLSRRPLGRGTDQGSGCRTSICSHSLLPGRPFIYSPVYLVLHRSLGHRREVLLS